MKYTSSDNSFRSFDSKTKLDLKLCDRSLSRTGSVLIDLRISSYILKHRIILVIKGMITIIIINNIPHKKYNLMQHYSNLI